MNKAHLTFVYLSYILQSALEASVKLLDEYERGQLSDDVSDADLWAAQKTKQAIIHPDTGEKIIMPFRMSGYIPFGSPIVCDITPLFLGL